MDSETKKLLALLLPQSDLHGAPLTEREQMVVLMILAGNSNGEIAIKLKLGSKDKHDHPHSGKSGDDCN